MSIVTCETAECSGISWLAGASRPVVATNDGDPEEQRDAGGDGGAERDQQDDQRADQRDLHLLGLVGAPLRPGGLRLRRGAVLGDEQLGMSLLDRGHGGQRGVGDRLELLELRLGVGLGRHREGHEHGAAVLGDGVRALLGVERALDVLDALDALEAVDDVLDGGGDLRIVGLDRALALDEHALADLLREAGVVDDHGAPLGVAVARGGVLQLVLPDLAADHGGEDDEQDPAEDRCLSMRRAPASGARREVLGLQVVVSGVRGNHCGERSQPRKAAVGRASGVLSGEIPWGPQRAGPRPRGGCPHHGCADVSARRALVLSGVRRPERWPARRPRTVDRSLQGRDAAPGARGDPGGRR